MLKVNSGFSNRTLLRHKAGKASYRFGFGNIIDVFLVSSALRPRTVAEPLKTIREMEFAKEKSCNSWNKSFSH